MYSHLKVPKIAIHFIISKRLYDRGSPSTRFIRYHHAMTEGVENDLSESLRLFHLHRQQLKETVEKLPGHFRDVNEFFSQAIQAPPDAQLFSGLEAATTAISELQHMSLDTEVEPSPNPCLVVLGQTKAGKSSLINALIGSEVRV